MSREVIFCSSCEWYHILAYLPTCPPAHVWTAGRVVIQLWSQISIDEWKFILLSPCINYIPLLMRVGQSGWVGHFHWLRLTESPEQAILFTRLSSPFSAVFALCQGFTWGINYFICVPFQRDTAKFFDTRYLCNQFSNCSFQVSEYPVKPSNTVRESLQNSTSVISPYK